MAGFIERAVALFTELRRRRVFRAAALYLVVGWAVIEASATVLPLLYVSEAVVRTITVLIVLGFPVALVVAWLYDITPEGLRRAPDSESPHASHPRARLILLLLTVGATALAGVGAWSLWLGPRGAAADESPLDPNRVAVLYFDDHSGGALAHVAEGFTEALIHELAQIEPLKVVSRNGVKPYRDTNVELDSIARALGAANLVEGSLEGDEDRLVATVQLIDGRTGDHTLSRRLERSGDDVLALRDAIVRESARLLSQTLGRELELERSRSETVNGEAWRLVERARSLFDHADTLRWKVGNVDGARRILLQADSLLAEAERLDPDWRAPTLARASGASKLAGLSSGVATDYNVDILRSGIEHVNRLLEDHPDDARGLALRGDLRLKLAWTGSRDGGRFLDDAEADLRRAVELDPGLATGWVGLADVLRRRGDFAEASVAAERALEADPFLIHAETHILQTLAHVWFELEDMERALRWNEESARRAPHEPTVAATRLAIMAGWSGASPDPDSAWAMVRDVEEAYGMERMWDHGYLQAAAVLVRAGYIDSAQAVVERVRETMPPEPWQDYYEARVRVNLGETDRAIDLLARFLEAIPERKDYIAEDWWWKPLRQEPRFQAIVADSTVS